MGVELRPVKRYSPGYVQRFMDKVTIKFDYDGIMVPFCFDNGRWSFILRLWMLAWEAASVRF